MHSGFWDHGCCLIVNTAISLIAMLFKSLIKFSRYDMNLNLWMLAHNGIVMSPPSLWHSECRRSPRDNIYSSPRWLKQYITDTSQCFQSQQYDTPDIKTRLLAHPGHKLCPEKIQICSQKTRISPDIDTLDKQANTSFYSNGYSKFNKTFIYLFLFFLDISTTTSFYIHLAITIQSNEVQ